MLGRLGMGKRKWLLVAVGVGAVFIWLLLGGAFFSAGDGQRPTTSPETPTHPRRDIPPGACQKGFVAEHYPQRYATVAVRGNLVAIPWAVVICQDGADLAQVSAEIDKFFENWQIYNFHPTYSRGEWVYLRSAKWRWRGQVEICPPSIPLPCLTEWETEKREPPFFRELLSSFNF